MVRIRNSWSRYADVNGFSLAAGIIRPFLIFVTEEVFLGQLFDAYIFRKATKDVNARVNTRDV